MAFLRSSVKKSAFILESFNFYAIPRCQKMSLDITAKTSGDGMPNRDHIVWVDCEMSGLNIENDYLLEIAMIVTDNDLKEKTTLGPLVIKTPKEVLDSMNDWCKEHHAKSGLTAACLSSSLTIQDADEQLNRALESLNISSAVLGGNSVGTDWLFLKKWCPKFSSKFHYRIIDVSAIKELVKRWYPSETAFEKKLTHRALDDIRESIDELAYYRKRYFVNRV